MNDMMLMALTDPAGAPAHPLIFLVLGVVTFALHLTAVNVMLGTLGLAAWGAFSKNPYWQRLARPPRSPSRSPSCSASRRSSSYRSSTTRSGTPRT